MAKAHDPVAAKAAYKALGLDDSETKEIDAALGNSIGDTHVTLRGATKQSTVVAKAQFHIGVGMLGTVTTGFNAENLSKTHRADIRGELCDVGIILHLGPVAKKIIPFSNIKEIDLA